MGARALTTTTAYLMRPFYAFPSRSFLPCSTAEKERDVIISGAPEKIRENPPKNIICGLSA